MERALTELTSLSTSSFFYILHHFLHFTSFYIIFFIYLFYLRSTSSRVCVLCCGDTCVQALAYKSVAFTCAGSIVASLYNLPTLLSLYW